mgnify:CR=1 FL=1
MKAICTKSFKTSEGVRFIKGNTYLILNQVSFLKDIKLVSIFFNNNYSFSTTKELSNKFFQTI